MRVVLVDDHLVFRECLRTALQVKAGFQIVAEASTPREAYEAVARAKADLLVTDLFIRDGDGIALLRELKRRHQLLPTLMVTRVCHPSFVRGAFDAGALGFALKDQPLAELVEAMKAVAAGRRYLSPALQSVSAEESATPGTGSSPALDQLSRREHEVFCRLVEGQSSKQIARALCISEKTVDSHRSHINQKLGLHSTPALLTFAAREGLVRN